MKEILFSTLLATAPCPESSNMQDLKSLSNYFTTEPFTSCTFNGRLVDCEDIPKLIEKQKNLPKNVDPNLM